MPRQKELCTGGVCGKITGKNHGGTAYADHYTTGHGCHHAAAGARPDRRGGGVWRAQPAAGLRRGHPDRRPPRRGEPDACGRHLPDPLPRGPYLWPARAFADPWGAGTHPPADSAGAGGAFGGLAGGVCSDRAAALRSKAAGLPRRAAGGAGCSFGWMARRGNAAAGGNKAPSVQSGLPAGLAPGGQVRPGKGAGTGRTGDPVAAFAAGTGCPASRAYGAARRGAGRTP